MFYLLLVPVLLALVGFIVSRRITWKEFLLQLGIQLVVVAGMYFAAMAWKTADTELWNGQVTKKWTDTQTCCHDYCCRMGTCSSGSGKSRRTYACCKQYCKRHGHDRYWSAENNLGETVYSNSCNSPSTSEPGRWSVIYVGEPTATEHSYVNYIKGNTDSILQRKGIEERFPGMMPEYPETYDLYRAHRLIPVGVTIPGYKALDDRLSEINGKLGPLRYVNVIFVVVKTADQMYLEGLREHWLGGKKNDFVVVVGAPEFPKIAWAGVLSWTRREDLKIDVRNALLDLGTFDARALDMVEDQIRQRFVRRPMSEFEYLHASMAPSAGFQIFLFIFSILLSIGLKVWLVMHDVFDDQSNETLHEEADFYMRIIRKLIPKKIERKPWRHY